MWIAIEIDKSPSTIMVQRKMTEANLYNLLHPKETYFPDKPSGKRLVLDEAVRMMDYYHKQGDVKRAGQLALYVSERR